MSVKTYQLGNLQDCGLDKGSEATIDVDSRPTDARLDVILKITANVGGNYETILEKTTLEADGEFGTVANTIGNRNNLYALATAAARVAIYKPRKGDVKYSGKKVKTLRHYLNQFLENETGITPEAEWDTLPMIPARPPGS